MAQNANANPAWPCKSGPKGLPISAKNKLDLMQHLWDCGHVKTTIDLPDSTFRQAKIAAAMRGMTFKRFLNEALEERLRRSIVESGADDAEPPWMAGFGGLSDLADENRRILDLIEMEFERLAPEDLQ